MKENINIAIVDDHQIVIDGLIAALKSYPAIKVAATATDGNAILSGSILENVDVLLTDVMMPLMSGQLLAREVKLKYPAIRIIALSMNGSGKVVEDMINQSDIAGYLLKHCSIAELAAAIDKVYHGGIYFQDIILEELRIQSGLNTEVEETRLTTREKQIIALMEKDLSNKEIAANLNIAVRTVETHRKNIFRKTGTNNLLSLVKWAYEHHIL